MQNLPYAALMDLGDYDTRVINKSPFTVGIGIGKDLLLTHHSIENSHAIILYENGSWWIEDINTTYGTFVNSNRVQQRTLLKRFDVIRFGKLQIDWLFTGH